MNNIVTLRRINVSLFFVFLALNFLHPLQVDDFCRGAKAVLSNHTLFKNLSEDYFGWTGRMSAQFLAYIFFNKYYETPLMIILNLINSVFILSLFYLTFVISIKNDNDKKTTHNYLIHILLYFIIFNLSGVLKNALWKTVGIQYLWGIILVLWLYYIVFYHRKNWVDNKYLMILAGVFIGLYNEIHFSIFLILVIYYIFQNYLSKQKNISKNIIYFLIGLVPSGIALLAAPGNFNRLTLADGSKHFSLLENLGGMSLYYWQHPMFFSLIILAIIFISFDRKKSLQNKVLSLLLCASVLLVLLPIGHIVNKDRILMLHIVIFSMIISHYLFNSEAFLSFVRKSSPAILIIPNSLIIALLFVAYFKLFQFNQMRIEEINKYRQNGVLDPIFTEMPTIFFKGFNKIFYFKDISADAMDWKNICFAEYYDFTTVRLKPKGQ